VGELSRAADALTQPELVNGALAAFVAVCLGRRWWPQIAGSVAVVAGLAWVAAVAAPVDGGAVLALALAAAVAVVPADGLPAAQAVPVAGVVGVLAAGGVFAVVPDTERALGVLGAVMVSTVAVRRLDRRWLATVAVCLAWVAFVDGAPRGSAVAGALGCAALPALLAVWPGRPPPARTWTWAVMTAAAVGARHAGLRSAREPVALVVAAVVGSAVCARVAGLRSSTGEAAVLVALVVAAELAAVAVVRRRPGTTPRPPRGNLRPQPN
jgi:hypothetical protein